MVLGQPLVILPQTKPTRRGTLKIIEKRIIHSGKKFDFAVHDLQATNGERIEREFIDHPGSVVLIPLLPGGRVVMVRQYRHPCDRLFLELPAGTANRGEPLEQTAVRELAEETGYRTARVERVMDVFPLPGATNERMGYFRCQDLTEGPVRREIDEEMDVEILTLEKALEMVDRGEICDGKTMIGLWWEARHSRQ